MSRRFLVLSAASAAVLALAGCATASSGSGGAPSTCSRSALHTHTAGTLTVGTDSPAYPPWFVDDKPTNGKGYESAVAYAVAKHLGYSQSQVKWVVALFSSVIAPTPKNYDFDINQVSITAKRAQQVDFSSGYYDVAQAIIALKKNKFSSATSVAGLKHARIGAQQGTTSLDAVESIVKPDSAVR